MEQHLSTTPFGRRTLSLGHIASQAIAKTRAPDKSAHKWTVFRAVCAGKAKLGLTERALAVLDALLSFHPETVLGGENLIVFPSNEQLALRAHGMPASTLRRQLAILVDAGIIVRRDSPNGKRYARKGRDGAIAQAFGFDLAPLVARAEEFEALAEEVRAEERALRLTREKITLLRRDIAKMIATGIEENVPTRRAGQGACEKGPSDWAQIHSLYRNLVSRIPRTATQSELTPIADDLALLAEEILSLLEFHVKETIPSANESQDERHRQNSNPNSPPEFEPGFQKSRAAAEPPNPPAPRPAETRVETGFPLGMVLEACPDILDYARDGISSWRDFLTAVALIRPMLGVSPSAFEEAQAIMGERQAATVLAAILQRGAAISSAGGYLRDLTRKAEAGQFSTGPMLMALIGSRKREKRRA
jgi:replication initiation protein RepC